MTSSTHTSKASRRAILLGLLLFSLLTLPLILAGRSGHSEMGDQKHYHLPVIELFSADLPSPDLIDYDSATAPGYHLLMASIHRATDGSMLAMISVTWLFGLGLLAAVVWHASRFVSVSAAVTLALPLAFSSYTIGGATALSTDNATLLFVCLAVGGAIFVPWNNRRAVGLSIAAFLAVGIRQIFVWTIAPIGLAGLLASPIERLMPSALRERTTEKKWSNLIASVLACALPVALLILFISMWHGQIGRASCRERV